MCTQSRISWSTCLQGLGSARLQGKLQGIVYIDDIMIMIILQLFSSIWDVIEVQGGKL